ncbi:hypothetical protein R3P38DRAFT_3320225 [Favolaschia claudopus]|uniref:Uncharacterized protein n=1 Tax=Favolaschia claudopus TaxID=2862362 RepID=A0AAW0AZB4_9AGAR
MFDTGCGVHFYLDQVAELTDARFVVPFRWIKMNSVMHGDVYTVKFDHEHKAFVSNNIIRISAALLKFNFLDLEHQSRVPEWSARALHPKMPNPLRAIAKGDPFYTIPHWNAYMTNRVLPRELIQHEFYVHFVTTSQQFQKLTQATHSEPICAPDPTSSTGCACYRLIVNTDPSDNPMQAEICSCMGATANHPCRKCGAGGTQEVKVTNEGYHAMFSVEHLLINDVLSQFKKAVDSGRDKAGVPEELKKWVSDHSNDIFNAFLMADEFDPSRDTPIELLHTILLGVLKYLWHVTHTSWTAEQKKLFEIRLQSTNIDGLSVEGLRAAYIVQYANSLIGRQFKALLQIAVFHIYDLVNETVFQAWKALGGLGALLWVPEIDNMTIYCADLHVAIGNFLDAFAEIDPSKMISKVKTHLLTHVPLDVRMFCPLLGAITEAFESFNGVF